jgi:undecaprenyl-diphosphatase
VVQGLTEFIPVSSSGHLVFFQSLFGLEEPQLFFDVMLHLGTLLAVILFFREDIRKIIVETVETLKKRERGREQTRLLLWILLATIPTGVMGILFKDWFESLFSKPRTVGFMIMITGVVLWLTRRMKPPGRTLERMGWLDSILIGIAQGIAIIPGISRSGSTISAGLFCGLDRELCGKFSFLLSAPAILGATLLELRKVNSVGELSPILIGAAVAFVVGILSLKFMMNMIKMGRVSNFSYYCWAVGILIVFLA